MFDFIRYSKHMASLSKSLFHNRDYRILLGGQIVSDFGSWISHLAYPLLFLAVTGSPLQAGISIALTNLPTFLFGLIAGAIVDSFDRKKVMIICDLIRVVLLGSIPLAIYVGNVSLIHLYLAAFLTGVCEVIFAVAEQTALTRVVKKEEIAQAFGQYEAVANTSSLIGPAIGGMLYQLSRSLPFLVDAISYALSAISLLFIRTEFQTTSLNKAFRRDEILQGMQWLWSHTLIRSIATVRAIGAIVSGGQTLLLILLANHHGASPAMIGVIFSIASIGVVLGSLLSHRIQKYLGTNEALILSRGLIAVALPLQLLSPNLVLLTITIALSYFAVAVYGTIATAHRLKLIPDVLQGRVNAFHRMLMFGGLAIGGALTGFLVEQVSLETTIVSYALLLGLLAIITAINLWPNKKQTILVV